uniref:F-box domain-containing protein n=1 Tax=Brassica oleracea var. oleracea TaxID=109376 RepID=A0A0D2ZWD0_BRAOL
MKSETEPSEKKDKKLNPSLSLFSFPDDIVLNCIARISTSYYPNLSLVSKTFASLISSYELYKTRCLQNTYEEILHVCLQFPMDRRPSWFSLWLKPNQTLTNDLERKEKSSRNALMVRNQCGYPASDLSVYKSGIWNWREAPNMTVARGEDVIAGVLNDKIYVMGGCSKDESKNWAEVFDTNTQTWESLPDPGVQLRCSPLRKIE